MSRALVTFAIGDDYQELLQLAQPGFQEYAELHGYDLLTQPPTVSSRAPSWRKVPHLHGLLDHYQELLWVDCDVVIVDPSWDLADDVPDRDWQALVCHHTPDGEVPNCGVWYLRPPMRPILERMWRMVQYTHHVWWEQAALLDLLGYHGYPARLTDPTELYARTCWLDLEWNSHEERDRHPRPRFAHATCGPVQWRHDVMRQYTERSTAHV
jgi:hypothetical protein